MSSVFATLRRKRDRTKGAAPHGTVFVPDSKSEPLFNSTPNLHKINHVVNQASSSASSASKNAGKLKKKESTAVFYPEEGEEEEDVLGDEHYVEKYGGFGSRRASHEGGDGNGHRYQKKGSISGSGSGSSGGGSLRHFASMISMFGSLKRTKSSRKMTHGSSQDFETDKRESSEFMRDRAAGRSRSPEDTELHPAKSQTNILDSDLEEIEKPSTNNMEPGVRSSSSGSEQDDNDNHHHRNDFKKSDSNIEKSEDETRFDYTTTKTEEELKRTKILIQGIKKFNMDPKKGIEFLVEHDILQNTPEDVAKFLKYGEGLSKTAIGKYLGEHVDFNEEVLGAFLDIHNFQDLILVQALREFLWSFRLPGESQKIDRMMEAFAKRYCQLNPGIFSCTDTCYLLSYSIIMLNTTLHNPSVKDKPTVEQFIQMNRDVDCGKSLNKAFLVQAYNSILAEPFKIPPEDANDLVLTFFNPNIEGWLWKQGGYKTWKRRWFILSNNCLYYFKFTTDKSPRGIIPLENVHAKEVSSSKSSELFPFILYKKSSRSMPSDVIKACKTLSNGTTVLSQYHTITVASINPEERKKWILSINQNNSNSDFYDVLTIKKHDWEQRRQNKASQGKSQSQSQQVSCSERKGTPQRLTRKATATATTNTTSSKSKHPPPSILPHPPKFEFDENEDEFNMGRSRRDQHDSTYKNSPVFSSHASISSGGAMERDSSYGSFSDISRSRSESRILGAELHDHDHDGSLSSVEHDTGSLGSHRGGGSSTLEERFCNDLLVKDSRYDLPKKLSVIEESQNLSDRSSGSSSGANHANPVTLGYRKLSEEEIYRDNQNHHHHQNSSHHHRSRSNNNAGAPTYLSDSAKCDNDNLRRLGRTNRVQGGVYNDPNQNRLGGTTTTQEELPMANVRYSRSGSIESDV